MKKYLASLLILLVFIWGVGKTTFFPSARLLQDTAWDFPLFFPAWGQRLISFFWVIPVSLGFLGWMSRLRGFLFSKYEKNTADFLGLSLAFIFFSVYVFGLSINGIFYWPLTAFFFIPGMARGWKEWRERKILGTGNWGSGWGVILVVPILPWIFEYLSPPIVWDAILDHFRYAMEVSRRHQIPLQWVNHTGDMPKGGELVLAGFWNLGGESLAKLSSAAPAFFTLWLLRLFSREWDGKTWIPQVVFLTCPYFLALYAWGYAEGFLAFFEMAAFYCCWKWFREPKVELWQFLSAFFLGSALSIKYTAVMALCPILAIFLFLKFSQGKPLNIKLTLPMAIFIPTFPWVLKNWMAFGNPFYPLATSVFGNGVGYGLGMEKGLLVDTGMPAHMGIAAILQTLWNSFFTAQNAVNAAWTPLVAMALPWVAGRLRGGMGPFILSFSILFLLEWIFVSSSLRHASGGVLAMIILAAMGWEAAFQEKGKGPKWLFGVGVFFSLWLCVSAQWTTTAPYASALGMEDPLYRLKRHYSFDMETYAAYRYIEDRTTPEDKVMAFAVFQTYPLQRTAYVDFKWKKPIFLEWASRCQTAGQLAKKLREEGVSIFLYQKWEAEAMSKVEKDFKLEGMPIEEYKKFWKYYMEPKQILTNTCVYQVKNQPAERPYDISILPGFEGKSADPGKS